MTDDVTHSTQFYIKHINRAILINLQHRLLKLGWLIVLQETHLRLEKSCQPPLTFLSETKNPPQFFARNVHVGENCNNERSGEKRK